jgi:hypothetical protein
MYLYDNYTRVYYTVLLFINIKTHFYNNLNYIYIYIYHIIYIYSFFFRQKKIINFYTIIFYYIKNNSIKIYMNVLEAKINIYNIRQKRYFTWSYSECIVPNFPRRVPFFFASQIPPNSQLKNLFLPLSLHFLLCSALSQL